ncbi:MAG: PAS domain S-box protein [Pseudomonadales bacterium]|jgi:PAS domain S-box-containing protein|nr:PAS domain S-box protein [Pseudomonadales bacterium]
MREHAPFSCGEHDVALLASIAQEMRDAIIVHSRDGAIRIWNRGAQMLFGYPPEAAHGLGIDTLIAPNDRRAYAAYLAQLPPGASGAPLEIRVLTRAGLHCDLQLTATLLPHSGDRPPVVVAIFRDISAQKSIENKLVALIESTPDPFILVAADERIQRVNRQAELLFGYERQELIQQSYKILVPERFRRQHDFYTHNYQVRPVMRQMGSGLELCCLTRAGEEIPVEIGLSPVVTQGETTIMVRFRDIREQKREQALLQQARQRADEANRSKSRFLAAASHDLRQPLQSISMNLGVLGNDLSQDDKARVIAQTRMALDTTNKLLNSLLNITKLESGKVQPEITRFPLAAVLERVYNTESQQARKKDQSFSLRRSSLSVNSDPVLLEQLLTNLVANAIRYTPPRGHILLGCRRRGAQVRIDVLDNGPGIAVEALDYIFDEYRQVEHSRRPGMGLGLGLSIVKLVAELLHLKLEVSSTPGKGSCFSVVVPLASAGVHKARQETAAAEQPRRLTGTLLLIDDDEAVLDATSLFLEICGFTVLPARDPATAMAALATTTPDLIVTDHGLAQQETGLDLLTRIRDHLGCEVPAIVITGDTSLQRHLAEAQPRLAVVCKPIDPQALLLLIQQQLGYV